MPAFALYRLPYQQHCQMVMQTSGQPLEFSSVFSLSGQSGFVVAPFTPDESHPILLLSADESVRTAPEVWLPGRESEYAGLRDQAEDILLAAQQQPSAVSGTKSHYMIDFANFHSQILAGQFSKIVLARCCHVPKEKEMNPLELFVKACHLYPRLMVALVAAPRCGAWLVATPELLLGGDGTTWTTMSLAGTMRLSGEQLSFDEPPSQSSHDEGKFLWSIKNREEQRVVSTYITECLEQVASDIEEDGPYTMRAGNLVHLRSDFRFTIADTGRLGELLHILYPTPAVCGLPKDAARDFIRGNEFAPREYYSGFMGMLCPEAETQLYVSLRCMRISRDGYSLYAGGGLLPDSNMETEWSETEDKMDTMKALISS